MIIINKKGLEIQSNCPMNTNEKNIIVFFSTFVPLTRTHYSYLPLISKHAQIYPSIVSCTHRNVFPCRYRLVKGLCPFLGIRWTFLPLKKDKQNLK